MNFAKFSIERNRVVLSILAVTMVLGIVFFTTLSRDSMPPYTIRVATVVTNFPGASPERIEDLVTDKIEKTAQEFNKTFLGKIPLHQDLRVASDKGIPLTYSNPTHEVSLIFAEIAKKILY